MNKRDDQSPGTHWEAVVATLFVRRKALGPHTVLRLQGGLLMQCQLMIKLFGK